MPDYRHLDHLLPVDLIHVANRLAREAEVILNAAPLTRHQWDELDRKSAEGTYALSRSKMLLAMLKAKGC